MSLGLTRAFAWSRRLLVLALCVAGTAGADTADGAPDAAVELLPQNTIWIQPVGTLVVPLVTSMIALGGVSHAWNIFSMGATLSTKHVNVVGEFGWARGTVVNLGTGNELRSLVEVWLSAGVAFHTGDRALSGFFLEPRLQLGVLYEDRARLDFAYDLQVGLNVGFQLVLARRVYVAFTIGGSVGGGRNQLRVASGPFFAGVVPQTAGIVVGVNANLVRVGFAF